MDFLIVKFFSLLLTFQTKLAKMRLAAQTCFSVSSCVLMRPENHCSDFREGKDTRGLHYVLEIPILIEVGKNTFLP
jgi:hypothetical protein